MELLLDVLLIRVNSQIKLYFKKRKLIFHVCSSPFASFLKTVFKFNIIHTHTHFTLCHDHEFSSVERLQEEAIHADTQAETATGAL